MKRKIQVLNYNLQQIITSLTPRKVLFSRAFNENQWKSGESRSGPGSSLRETENLRKELPTMLSKFEINSILDIPCGDFNWMKEINLEGFNYIGGDIVDEIIQKNKNLYTSENISFKVMDLIKDTLPNVSLIICRDCFIHFSYKDIFKSIENFKKTGSLYLLTTNYFNCNQNRDKTTSIGSRPINLTLSPFNFPSPLFRIKDGSVDGSKDDLLSREMALWKIDNLL